MSLDDDDIEDGAGFLSILFLYKHLYTCVFFFAPASGLWISSGFFFVHREKARMIMVDR